MRPLEVLPGRIAALDGLRTFAVTAVLIAHLDLGVQNGGFGVNVFFTLSGFLITMLLLAEHERAGTIRYLRFLARRALRLGPALLAMVAVVLVWTVPMSSRLADETQNAALSTVFYVSNWFRATGDQAGMFAHTWSLSVEEQFYLGWPLLLLAGHRVWGRRGVLVLALTGAAVSLGLRHLLWDGPDTIERIYNGTDTVADQLLIGCALAVLMLEAPRVVARLATAAPLALAVIVGFMISDASAKTMFLYGYAVLPVATAVVIAHLALRPSGVLTRVFSTRPMVAVGRISYGVYLWHFPLVLMVGGRTGTVVTVIVVVPATLVAAWLSYRFLETPVIRWRRRVASSDAADRLAVDGSA